MGEDRIRGNEGNDILRGREDKDTIDGGEGSDTIEGNQGADTLKAGPQDELATDSVYGNDGDDKIETANYPAFADTVDCGQGDKDEATADPQDAVPDPWTLVGATRCENVMRIEERSSDRIKGYFDNTSTVHVEFDAYVDNEEGGIVDETDPDYERYEKGVSSIITLDDDRLPGDEDRIQIKLTLNSETDVIKLRVTTPEGADRTLSDTDRRAVEKAGDMLGRFLGRPDFRGQKNERALVTRHFSILAESHGELKDRTIHSPDENRSQASGTNASNVNLSSQGQTPSVGIERCMPNTSGNTTALSTRYNPAVQYRYLQSSDEFITYLDCSSATNYATYGGETYEVPYGPATGEDFGRCGFGSYLQFGYTQDCLNHDACVADLGYLSPTCIGIFDSTLDDAAFGPEYDYCDSSTAALRAPATRDPAENGRSPGVRDFEYIPV